MVRSVWHRSLLVLIGTCAVALLATLHLHSPATAAGAATDRAGVLAATPAAAVRATPECRAAQLDADYRARDASAGHRHGVVRLTNVGAAPCVLQGWGGLSYVGGGDGTQVGAAADRDRGTARRVVLASGDRALSAVDETVAQNYPRRACRPTPVDGFRVYAPDQTRSLFVAHPTTGCRSASVHLLSHGPYRG